MGICFGKQTGGGANPEDKSRDRQVRQIMKDHKRTESTEVKMLLLGTGESGKSTVFKQVRIIHKKGYDDEERRRFLGTIHSNVFICAKALAKAVSDFGLQYDANENREYGELVQGLNMTEYTLDEAKAERMKALWEDSAVQKAFQRRSEFQLYDCCEYFFADLKRISAPGYIPSTEDILRARLKTVGITEIEFAYKGINFRVVDVGGQRNERRKWIHTFDSVTAIIFVVALSEYDQKLFEDNKMNRMHESLLLFDEICNNRYFKDTPVIVFFNKDDLFREKIARVDLKTCFPEYDGGCNYENALAFIEKKFTDENKNKRRTVFSRVTCATDTNSIQTVFHATQNIILEMALADAQLI